MIRPLHGYGTKDDGTGNMMLIGLTTDEVARSKAEPIHFEVDARFQPVTDIVIFYGETRDEVRRHLTTATTMLGIPVTVERGRP